MERGYIYLPLCQKEFCYTFSTYHNVHKTSKERLTFTFLNLRVGRKSLEAAISFW